MKTSIVRSIESAGLEIQYDTYVKQVLSDRQVLAWILKHAVEEFAGYDMERIMADCLGEEAQVSQVPLLPGGRIDGVGKEDKVPGEGTVFYDIRFSAYTAGKTEGESVKILLNIEGQKKFYGRSKIVTRGIFYTARMISAQADIEFPIPYYSGMKKVYSIWVCMNAPNYIGDAVSEYHIGKRDILEGIPDKKKDYDKLSVVMICLNRKSGKRKANKLTEFLNVLLSPDMGAEEKEKILSEKFNIKMDNGIGEELRQMCNLGQGIREEAEKAGWKAGRRKGRQEGRREGRRAGRREGLAIGKAQVLVRMIETVMQHEGMDLEAACGTLEVAVEDYYKAKEVQEIRFDEAVAGKKK